MHVLMMIGCLVLASRASAEPTPPPVVPGSVDLVRHTDATWRYQVFRAPPLAPQIGALAISGLDVAAGRAQHAIELLGDDQPAPAAWPYDVDTPSVAKGTLAPTAPDARIASLFAVTTFELGPEDRGLRVIEIRLRYRDGCAVWLNGFEVARRSLATGTRTTSLSTGTRTTALATRMHGAEWETFYVPVAPSLLQLGANVLAVEVHPSGRRDGPELAADVIGRRDVGLLRGPVISDVTATTATISIETDTHVEASLEWGTGAALDHRLTSAAGRIHRFLLAGLPAHARITYRVQAGATRTPELAFHTAPKPGDVVRIGIYGDVRGGHDTHRRLIDAMLGEGLDLVAATGDMVTRGTDDADWQRFFAVAHELLAQVRYVSAIGNHDLGWVRPGPAVFGLPPGPPGRPDHAYYYSLDVADIHLVFLDSNAYELPEQEQWLDADLAAARRRGVRAIIALTHDGPYSRGIHRGNELARDRYVPILARHHVDLLVAGHDHLYQRGEAGGIHYVVSGGGGAGLYKPTCGTRHKPRCPEDGMQMVASEHHYIVLAIDRDTLELCPRKTDGKLLERCARYRLRRP